MWSKGLVKAKKEKESVCEVSLVFAGYIIFSILSRDSYSICADVSLICCFVIEVLL